jgi:DnaA family protein
MKQLALDIGLASRPTLANFFAGPNASAVNHLRLWTASAQRAPVPSYLWGGPGSGKTHLLQAVHHALQGQGAQVGWLDAHSMDPPDFNPDWAAVLMDDVHQYNPEQQHTAFNWFVNALSPRMGLPRWVLAAGALPPTDLKLRDDLRSRLGWGHIEALQVLSEPERRAVLRQAADARGLFLSDEVMAYMLKRFSRDLASLMQLLDHLDHYALQTQRALTIPLVRAMLENE